MLVQIINVLINFKGSYSTQKFFLSGEMIKAKKSIKYKVRSMQKILPEKVNMNKNYEKFFEIY